jgi:tetratricopeptide (TPR) repeat protein/tRNA A-37 threonylcarbamoyl transferase component Bud32
MGACLTNVEAAEFAGGGLSESRNAEVERHLESCRACLGAVARTASVLMQVDAKSPALEPTVASPAQLEADAAPLQLDPGATAGRYRIARKLGSGGMGTVYLADDPALERKVAIKVLRGDRSASRSLRARLLREAHAMARLAHPHVVSVYDVGLLGEDVFIVMEYVDGVTLREWLAPKEGARPSLERVLDAFVDAGRGLMEAHASGLVHRDFKPDNVLIAVDARARVSDFGLAEPITGAVDGDGALAGTPAYMAPEQWRGDEASTTSDVYSFAVSLFEATQGERPFTGQSLDDLRENVLAGRMRPWRRPVPSWLKRLLVRALSVEPAARPSLAGLVERIARRKARGRAWLAGAAAATTLAIVAGAWLVEPRIECRAAARRLDGAWDASRRQAVRAAFVASGARLIDERFAAVERALDGYAREWAALDEQVCRATRVDHAQSDELYDLRMECLAQRRRELAAFTELLTHADAQLVDDAPSAAARLSRLDDCSDVATLTAPVREPKDPAVRKQVDEARAQVARAKALNISGRYLEGRAAASEAVREARAIGYAPVEAEALSRLADAESLNAHDDEGARLFEATVEAAERGRHDAVRVHAMSELVLVVGSQQRRFTEGHQYARQAAAILDRLGDLNGDAAAKLAMNVGLLDATEGKLEDAERELRRALALGEALRPPDARVVALALANLAIAVDGRGQHEQAIELDRRAASIFESFVGPHHPVLATTLNNLGGVQYLAHHCRDSLASSERALAIREVALEPDHPDWVRSLVYVGVAWDCLGEHRKAMEYFERALPAAQKAGPMLETLVVVNLAEGNANLGEFTLALKHAQRALELRRQTLGDAKERIAGDERLVGEQLLHLQRLAEAEKYLVEAKDALTRARGPEPEELGLVRADLGWLRMQQRRPADALKEFERARAIVAAATSEDSIALVDSLRGIGLARIELHQAEHAVAPLERAYQLESGAEGNEEERAKVAFPLARALWDAQRDRARARSLATSALAILSRSPADGDEVARIRAWLATRE